jgi:hypothetical protein
VLKVKVVYFINFFSRKYHLTILIFNGHLQCRSRNVCSTVRHHMSCIIFDLDV